MPLAGATRTSRPRWPGRVLANARRTSRRRARCRHEDRVPADGGVEARELVAPERRDREEEAAPRGPGDAALHGGVGPGDRDDLAGQVQLVHLPHHHAVQQVAAAVRRRQLLSACGGDDGAQRLEARLLPREVDADRALRHVDKVRVRGRGGPDYGGAVQRMPKPALEVVRIAPALVAVLRPESRSSQVDAKGASLNTFRCR
mmetsp:Transcript_50426/g.150801  ORF Transcript_50426/g.150801 Transcript_50426/m.150801 type:complete len:202 (+) Transcript_50426:462-1067(+)